MSGAYDTEIIPETIGALPSSDIVAGGLGVSPVPRPRPDNLVMGRSPIKPTVTVSTSRRLNNPTNIWRFARRCDTTDDYRQPK
jgi:hypothetical protein